MEQPLLSIKKELSSGHGGRLIRVLIADGKGFDPTTFSEAEVERVTGIGEERSALVLRSGVKIPVALSYEQLEQKIYQPDFKNDGPVLDLRNVTGEVAKPRIHANTNQAPWAPGGKMLDGTVFAGISPDTDKPMYATPADASLTMKFSKAQKYAAELDAYGHKDWRVPTKAELNVLFNNRAAIGGFDISGSGPAGWYWSASPNDKWDASWCQRLSDGAQVYNYMDGHLSVRPVR
jgi:hypothetical protein